MKKLLNDLKGPADRRSFMKKGLAAAGTATVGAGLLGRGLSAFGQERAGAGSRVEEGGVVNRHREERSGGLTRYRAREESWR